MCGYFELDYSTAAIAGGARLAALEKIVAALEKIVAALSSAGPGMGEHQPGASVTLSASWPGPDDRHESGRMHHKERRTA